MVKKILFPELYLVIYLNEYCSMQLDELPKKPKTVQGAWQRMSKVTVRDSCINVTGSH